MTGFTQNLNVAEGSISIVTPHYNVLLFVDANANTVYVNATTANGVPFSVSASIDIYRNATMPANTEQSCKTYYDTPDTVVDPTTSTLTNCVVWYHRNIYVNDTQNFYNDTMWQQGVNPDTISDPFVNKTFGGAIMGSSGMTKLDATTVTGADIPFATIAIAVLTEQVADVNTWLSDLGDLIELVAQQTIDDVYTEHVTSWEGIWNRSFIDISPTSGSSTTQADVDAIRFHYVWQRFLDLCDGRNAATPMKFNGQAFTVDVGSGPDYRDWGSAYWFVFMLFVDSFHFSFSFRSFFLEVGLVVLLLFVHF